MAIDYPCTECIQNVLIDAIECSLCLCWTHRKCAKLTKKEMKKLDTNDEYWYCRKCKQGFPFVSTE